MMFNSKTVLPFLAFALMFGRCTAGSCWCDGRYMGGCSADLNRVFKEKWSDAGDGVRYSSESGCKSTASRINSDPNSGSDRIECSGGHGHCSGWSNGGCYGHLRYSNSAACQRGTSKLNGIFSDECLPKPCQNGATCVDKMNSFECTCKSGYTGSTCTTDINECEPQPCQNGASCTDKVNGYTCSCQEGFLGSTCATNIDECSPDPCQNGGTCTDKVNGYQCTCKSGYSGSTCAVTTTVTTTTTPTTVTTYQPQRCHGELEAAGCGSRVPTADCSVGGVHQEFAETHCPVMCGLDCTSTVTTLTTTSTSTTVTATTTTTTTTTYQPQRCHGELESAGCGSRVPTADCSVGGVHQEFAETHCPVMCGLDCTTATSTTNTATSTTNTVSSTTTLTGTSTTTTTLITTTTTTTTTTTWLGIHKLCDPLVDLCNRTVGLVCDHTTYTCRYRKLTTTTTTAIVTDDEQGAVLSASGDSGGSINVGLYAGIGGGVIVLVGIIAFWRQGSSTIQGGAPMTNKRPVAAVNNQTFKGVCAGDDGESSYQEMGIPGSSYGSNNAFDAGVPMQQSRTMANAAYEDIPAGNRINNNATYEDISPNANADDDVDFEC